MPPSASAPGFDLSAIRRRFPALRQKVNGVQPVYFDNPGGTQVPASVIQAMRRSMIDSNSNHGGAFYTSRLLDQAIRAARAAMADLFNAPTPDQVVFGPNMTTLTFSLSRAIGRTLAPGDELIVTRMDHDANISPWLLMARDHGLTVRWADFDVETGRLDYAGLESLVNDRTRVVACVYASNALGTINDVRRIVEIAHSVGALAYIDAVQYAPHGPIDVQALDVDFLVCSSYKFFGPHLGMLYGKSEHLTRLPAYKVRPAPDSAPERWETGTQNHEGLAGLVATVEYLAWIGEQFGGPFAGEAAAFDGRRRSLKLASQAIAAYEKTLSARLAAGLEAINGVHTVGITDPGHLDERVPTFIFTVDGVEPVEVAREMDRRGIYLWDGNYYAQAVMERLGREGKGGMVRVGPVHYNTRREVDRFLNALEDIAG
jgi:cysteine desulfurase family protein (TIGR01976 family)